jgi:hypothetical protein
MLIYLQWEQLVYDFVDNGLQHKDDDIDTSALYIKICIEATKVTVQRESIALLIEPLHVNSLSTKKHKMPEKVPAVES